MSQIHRDNVSRRKALVYVDAATNLHAHRVAEGAAVIGGLCTMDGDPTSQRRVLVRLTVEDARIIRDGLNEFLASSE